MQYFKTLSEGYWLIVDFYADKVELRTLVVETGEHKNLCVAYPDRVELCKADHNATSYAEQRACSLTRHYCSLGFDVVHSCPELTKLGFARLL